MRYCIGLTLLSISLNLGTRSVCEDCCAYRVLSIRSGGDSEPSKRTAVSDIGALVAKQGHTMLITFSRSLDERCVTSSVLGVQVRTIPDEELHRVDRHVCRCVDEWTRVVFAAEDIEVDARGFHKQLEDFVLRFLRSCYDRARKWSITKVWIGAVSDESIDSIDTFVVARSLQGSSAKEPQFFVVCYNSVCSRTVLQQDLYCICVAFSDSKL
jgi:hypothetical protein